MKKKKEEKKKKKANNLKLSHKEMFCASPKFYINGRVVDRVLILLLLKLHEIRHKALFTNPTVRQSKQNKVCSPYRDCVSICQLHFLRVLGEFWPFS